MSSDLGAVLQSFPVTRHLFFSRRIIGGLSLKMFLITVEQPTPCKLPSKKNSTSIVVASMKATRRGNFSFSIPNISVIAFVISAFRSVLISSFQSMSSFVTLL